MIELMARAVCFAYIMYACSALTRKRSAIPDYDKYTITSSCDAL